MISKYFFSLLALVVTVPLQVCQAQITYNSQAVEFMFNLNPENPDDFTNTANWRRGKLCQASWTIVDPGVEGLRFDLMLAWVNPHEGGFIWSTLVGYNVGVSEGGAYFKIPSNTKVPYTYQLFANFNGAAINAVSEPFELTA